MKTSLLIALSLLFTANVFAKDLASYRFAIRDNAEGSTMIHHIVSTITDEAELKVTFSTFGGLPPFFYSGDSVPQEFYSQVLNKHVFTLLKNDIMALSQAELEKRTNQIVCMMMPGPTLSNNHLSVRRGYDYNTQSFLGEMELVDGPHGCWVRSATYPKNTYDRATAAKLKRIIKAITLDHIGAEL